MTDITKEEEISNLMTAYAKHDLDGAVLFVTLLFIALNECYVHLSDKTKDGDEKKAIEIEGDNRNITIHAVMTEKEKTK